MIYNMYTSLVSLWEIGDSRLPSADTENYAAIYLPAFFFPLPHSPPAFPLPPWGGSSWKCNLYWEEAVAANAARHLLRRASPRNIYLRGDFFCLSLTLL